MFLERVFFAAAALCVFSALGFFDGRASRALAQKKLYCQTSTPSTCPTCVNITTTTTSCRNPNPLVIIYKCSTVVGSDCVAQSTKSCDGKIWNATCDNGGNDTGFGCVYTVGDCHE
jgi:hypothetical protein